jgi:hypothetical protein
MGPNYSLALDEIERGGALHNRARSAAERLPPFRSYAQFLEATKVGWTTGLEPATAGITIRGSTS